MMLKILVMFLVVALQCGAAAPQKVISYNIRYDSSGDKGDRDWSVRRSKVIKFVQDEKPSILGLQEVLESQLKFIEKNLPGYGRVGVGRYDGKTKGEYSPVFYDKSVWKVDEKQHGTFWLSDTPKVAGSRSWGNGITRICTWVRLIDNDGKGIYVYNTHWDHRSQNSREKSAVLILKTIKNRQHKSEPYILMGDFNATTENVAMKNLLKEGLLVDHCEEQMKTFNFWKADLVKGLRIDHIFVAPSLNKVEVRVAAAGDPPASDHHPVVMTIDFIMREKP